MEMDFKCDLLFFIDHKSLIEGNLEFLNYIDFSKTKVEALSPVINEFNNYYKSIDKSEVKSQIKTNKIDLLNNLLNNNKIGFINEDDEKNMCLHLLNLLVRRYYKQNIIIITNDLKQANMFLPLIPIFEAFGHILKIVSIKEEVKEYEFSGYNDAKAQLNIKGKTVVETKNVAEDSNNQVDVDKVNNASDTDVQEETVVETNNVAEDSNNQDDADKVNNDSNTDVQEETVIDSKNVVEKNNNQSFNDNKNDIDEGISDEVKSEEGVGVKSENVDYDLTEDENEFDF